MARPLRPHHRNHPRYRPGRHRGHAPWQVVRLHHPRGLPAADLGPHLRPGLRPPVRPGCPAGNPADHGLAGRRLPQPDDAGHGARRRLTGLRHSTDPPVHLRERLRRLRAHRPRQGPFRRRRHDAPHPAQLPHPRRHVHRRRPRRPHGRRDHHRGYLQHPRRRRHPVERHHQGRAPDRRVGDNSARVGLHHREPDRRPPVRRARPEDPL